MAHGGASRLRSSGTDPRRSVPRDELPLLAQASGCRARSFALFRSRFWGGVRRHLRFPGKGSIAVEDARSGFFRVDGKIMADVDAMRAEEYRRNAPTEVLPCLVCYGCNATKR